MQGWLPSHLVLLLVGEPHVEVLSEGGLRRTQRSLGKVTQEAESILNLVVGKTYLFATKLFFHLLVSEIYEIFILLKVQSTVLVDVSFNE